METFKVRIVNSGLAGEPFHYCFQNEETRQIIEFSQITNVIRDGVSSSVAIEDSNLDNVHISEILNNYLHVIDIQHTEEGGYELFFN